MTREARIEATIRATFPEAVVPSPVTGLSAGDLPEWDSLGHYNLLLAIEEEFGFRFTPEELSEVRTVEQIQAVIAKHEDGP